MTDLIELEERLASLGRHLDGERATRTGVRPPQERLRRQRGRAAVLVTVGCLVAASAFVLNQRPGELPIAEPTAIPADAAAPGSTAPTVEEPPAWFGQPRGGERSAADRTGRWTSSAIGIDDGAGNVRSPIWVGTTDGSLRGLDEAPTIVVEDLVLRSLVYGDSWQALATTSEPVVVAGGAVGVEALAAVIRSVRVGSERGVLALQIDELPEGYVELISPQVHGPDVAERRTLTNARGDVSINEISDWFEPELAAAAAGVDYRMVEVGDTIGWTGRTDFNPDGPVTFLIWSPEPGIVLEIDASDPRRPIADLVALARSVQLLPAEEWDELHN